MLAAFLDVGSKPTTSTNFFTLRGWMAL